MKHQWAPLGNASAFIGPEWLNGLVKVGLLRPGFVYDPDAHGAWSNISGYEIAGTGYTSGGITLTGKTATYVAASDLWNLDADDVEWGQIGGPFATFDAAAAAVYDAGNGYLWSFIDFEGTKSVVGGVFSLQFDPQGVLYTQALAPV